MIETYITPQTKNITIAVTMVSVVALITMQYFKVNPFQIFDCTEFKFFPIIYDTSDEDDKSEISTTNNYHEKSLTMFYNEFDSMINYKDDNYDDNLLNNYDHDVGLFIED